MKKKRTIFVVLLIILILFFIAAGGGYLYYRVNRVDMLACVPAGQDFYLEINSFEKLYENVINLKVVDLLITSDPRIEGIIKTVNELRSNAILQSSLLKKVLNIKITVFFNDDLVPVIITDLGSRSILTGLVSPLIPYILSNNEALSVQKIFDGRFTYYKLKPKTGESEYYACFYRNLLIFSLDIDGLFKALNCTESESVLSSEKINNLKKMSLSDGDIRIYLKTADILKGFFESSQIITGLLEKVVPDEYAALSLKFSNEQISLDCYTGITAEDETVRRFIESPSEPKKIGKYIPEDAIVVTSSNFRSFKDVVEFISYIYQGDGSKIISGADQSARLLFNGGIDELFFDWIGNEAGVIGTSVSTDPVVFLEIADRSAFDSAKNKLFSSFLIEGESTYILDNVRMDHIRLPAFIDSVIKYFIPDFIEPYYITIDDFVFFSLSPESLYDIVTKFEQKNSLLRDETYKNIVGAVDNDSNLLFYYNLELGSPSFLPREGLAADIIRLYQKGVLSVDINRNSLRLKLSAEGVLEKKLRGYPGFPRAAGVELAGDIYPLRFTGGRLPEFVYQSKENMLYVSDINNRVLSGFPIQLDGKIKGEMSVITDTITDKKLLLVYTDKGEFYRIDIRGNIDDNIRFKTDFISSIGTPMIANYGVGVFDHAAKILYFVKNSELEPFSFEFKNALFAPPSLIGGNLMLYPRSFSGEIYLVDREGQNITGWPVTVNGIGQGSPVINQRSPIERVVAFITQNGELSMFNGDGTLLAGFPVMLEGVFFTQGVFGNFDGSGELQIALIDSNGRLYIVNRSGMITLRREIDDGISRDTRVAAYDIDKDNKTDIVIYGGTNNFYAFNYMGSMLAGFPQKGSMAPYFTDIDSDGAVEIIIGSFDGFIYCYTMPE